MEFPEGFFDDEVREDFYVSGLMKRYWAANLEVYLDVVKVCEKYNLKWFADYGTALGAVRHGGYIPWDDDFDICMLREDYMRFIEVAEKELPGNYVVKNCHTTKDDLLTRIDNERGPSFYDEFLDKYHGCFLVSGIDVFPLDNMAPTEEELEAHRNLIRAVNSFEIILKDETRDEAELEAVFEAIEQLTGFRISRDDELVKQLYQALESVCALYAGQKSDMVMLSTLWASNGTKTYPSSCFKESVWLQFEGIRLPVSAQYDTQLCVEYGDYMRIMKGGASHEYPCFKDMEQYVIDNLPEYRFKYTYNPEDLTCRDSVSCAKPEKEILIIPYRANTWETIEPIWRENKNTPGVRVSVILPPYYELSGLGGFTVMHDDSDKLPSYVDAVPYDQYDFANRNPDEIYIQNPYDECNYTSSVHPFFYSKNLKKYTDRLIYVPWFNINSLPADNGRVYQTMNYFVTVPGLFHADEVILQSEQAKQAYIKKLTDFAGEDTRDIWEKKLVVNNLGYRALTDKDNRLKQHDVLKRLLESWNKLLYDNNGRRKQTVLYDISAPAISLSGDYAIDKIDETLKIFEANKDSVALIWRANRVTEAALEATDLKLYTEYSKLVRGYIDAGWGIYDDVLDYKEEVCLADVYYGSAGYIARAFEMLDKPTMIQYIKPLIKPEVPVIAGLWKNEAGNIPFHVRAGVRVGEYLYFVTDDFNALCRMSFENQSVEIIDVVPEENINTIGLFSRIEYYEGRIILVPNAAKAVWIYNLESGEWKRVGIKDENQPYMFSFSVLYSDKLYLFGNWYKNILCIDLKDDSVRYLDDIYESYLELEMTEMMSLISQFARVDDELYILCWHTNLVLKFNLRTEEYEWMYVGENARQYNAISYDGKYFYLVPKYHDKILRWDGCDDFAEFDLPEECLFDMDGLMSANITDNKLVMHGYNSDTLIMDIANPMSMTVLKERYIYNFKRAEENYTYHEMESNAFVLCEEGRSFRFEKTCFTEKQLKAYADSIIENGKVSFKSGNIKEDDVIGINYILQYLQAGEGDRTSKKQIVFMPYKASMWDSLESIYLAAAADERCEAIVVPIPYYDKNNRGELTQYHYEGDKFPDYVRVVDYREYDLEAEHPDVIYIHNPYDDGNHVTSIAPEFYSAELKKHTDKLVYVPYYATSGGMGEGQALCRVYLNADYIVVQAEKHKEYFDSVIPREKFLNLGSPKFDKVINTAREDIEIPDAWKQKLSGKKAYFYNTSLGGMLSDTEAFLDKMEYVFKSFIGREDACIVWRPHPLFETTIKSARQEYLERYEEVKAFFIDNSIGIYDTSADIEATIAVCDAYIGDAGTSVTALFGVAGKPLFILDNYIHRLPADEDRRKQTVTGYSFDKQTRWKVSQGNKLYYSEKDDFSYKYYCDLGEYASGSYYGCIHEYNGRVFAFPANAQDILVIENKQTVDTVKLERKIEQWGAFADVKIAGRYAFLIPFKYPYIVRFDMESCEVDYIDGCRELITVNNDGEYRLGSSCIWNGYLMLASPVDKRVIAVDCETLELQLLEVGARRYRGAVKLRAIGDDIWLLPYTGTNVVKWNPASGEAAEYNCRVEGFTCYKRPQGDTCLQLAFGSVAVSGDKAILAPLWGNMFVELDLQNGAVRQLETDIDMEYHGNKGYDYSGGQGGFIGCADGNTAYFYHDMGHRLYRLDLFTGRTEEVRISFDEQEIRLHEAGFARQSEWLRYGCMEGTFNSLEDFLSDNITGGSFDKEEQLAAYGEIATNGDGSSGRKIHEYVMSVLDKE